MRHLPADAIRGILAEIFQFRGFFGVIGSHEIWSYRSGVQMNRALHAHEPMVKATTVLALRDAFTKDGLTAAIGIRRRKRAGKVLTPELEQKTPWHDHAFAAFNILNGKVIGT